MDRNQLKDNLNCPHNRSYSNYVTYIISVTFGNIKTLHKIKAFDVVGFWLLANIALRDTEIKQVKIDYQYQAYLQL